MFPHLSPRVRFLAYNQRSYEGSSPALPKGRATATYLQDLLGFLRHLIDQGIITKKGGVSLLGWSKGCVLPIALLGTPAEQSAFLEPYLRSIILHEVPGSALARPPTADLKEFMQGMTPETMPARFANFITQYSGDDAGSLPPSDPETLKAITPGAWEPHCVQHGYEWTLNEIDVDGKQALSESNGYLARVPVGVLVGHNTVEYCKDAAQATQECFETAREKTKRQVRWMSGANHFAFVVRPEEYAGHLSGLMAEIEA